MFDVIPTNGETWLICGGRTFSDREMFDDAMGRLIRLRGVPAKIVSGAARGADSLAIEWAERMGIDVAAEPADWKTHGRAAGPIRNQLMLDRHAPKVVVAFPGGTGTADMVKRARRRAEITVVEIVPR